MRWPNRWHREPLRELLLLLMVASAVVLQRIILSVNFPLPPLSIQKTFPSIMLNGIQCLMIYLLVSTNKVKCLSVMCTLTEPKRKRRLGCFIGWPAIFNGHYNLVMISPSHSFNDLLT